MSAVLIVCSWVMGNFGRIANLWTLNSVQLWYHWSNDVFMRCGSFFLDSLFICLLTFMFYGDLCSPQHMQGWHLIN